VARQLRITGARRGPIISQTQHPQQFFTVAEIPRIETFVFAVFLSGMLTFCAFLTFLSKFNVIILVICHSGQSVTVDKDGEHREALVNDNWLNVCGN